MDLPFCESPVGCVDYRGVNLTPLLGLKILERRQRRGIERPRIVMVENKAQRLEFMAQDVDTLKRSRIHGLKAYRP